MHLKKKWNMGQISFCVASVSLSFLLICSLLLCFIYIEHFSSPFVYEFSVVEKKLIPCAVCLNRSHVAKKGLQSWYLFSVAEG